MIPLRALLPLLPLWLSAPAMAQAVGDDAVPVDDPPVSTASSADDDEDQPSQGQTKRVRVGASTDATDTSDASDPTTKKQQKKKKKKKSTASTSTASTKPKTSKSSTAKSKSKSTKSAMASDDDDAIVLAVDAEASLAAGGLTGDGIHRGPDGGPVAMTVVAADIEPSLRWNLLTLSLPSKLEHRETWGGHLSRTNASSSLALEIKPMRQFRGTLEVGVAAQSKPQWLDPYQPIDDIPDNGLVATDRRGHVDMNFGARVMAVPWSRTWTRLNYGFVRSTSVQDPAFDPLERPNHLTPRNHDEHSVRASFKTTLGSLKPSIGVNVFRRDWFFVFARDKGTAATHAGPGGTPPNPLQSFHGVEMEPGAELTLLDGALVLDVGWRLRLVQDLYDGYYSRMENRFSMGVDTSTGPEELMLETKTRLDVNTVIYGDNAYAVAPNHPPLDYGDRRELRRWTLSFAVRFPARASVRAFAEVAATAQVTNFPDYAPGVFPTTRSYVVDWDYQTARAMVGLEMALDVEDTPLR